MMKITRVDTANYEPKCFETREFKKRNTICRGCHKHQECEKAAIKRVVVKVELKKRGRKKKINLN